VTPYFNLPKSLLEKDACLRSDLGARAAESFFPGAASALAVIPLTIVTQSQSLPKMLCRLRSILRRRWCAWRSRVVDSFVAASPDLLRR